MDNLAKARKIREKWAAACEEIGANPFSPFGLKKLDELVAAEIEAAYAETKIHCPMCETHNPGTQEGHLCPHLQNAYKAGFTAAKERAVEIAEEKLTSMNQEVALAVADLADRIRTMEMREDK